MSGHFVFGKPVLFAFSLGLTTPYSLGILVWKFYQTFFHCVYWVLSDIWAPNSSHKIFTICFLHHCQGWKEGSFVCETAWFFPMHILICLTWNWSRFVPNSVKILTWNFRKKLFWGNFSEFLCKPRLSYTKTSEIWQYFLQFYSGSVLRWKSSHKCFHMLFAPR